MRSLAAVLLLALVPVFGFLGVLFIFSSGNKAVEAVATSGDLSSVAQDLASPEELASQRAAADKRLEARGKDRGGTHMAIAVGFFVALLASLVGGVLCLMKRGKMIVVGCAAVSGLIPLVALVGDTYMLHALSAAVLAILALVAALRAKDWRQKVRPGKPAQMPA